MRGPAAAILLVSVLAGTTGCLGSDDGDSESAAPRTVATIATTQDPPPIPQQQVPPIPKRVRGPLAKTLAKDRLTARDLAFLEATAALRCRQASLAELASAYGARARPGALADAVARSWTASPAARRAIRKGCRGAVTSASG
jgi:hypothetical protein